MPTPTLEDAESLIKESLPIFETQLPNIRRVLDCGPSSKADQDLIARSLAFAMAQLQIWQNEKAEKYRRLDNN